MHVLLQRPSTLAFSVLIGFLAAGPALSSYGCMAVPAASQSLSVRIEPGIDLGVSVSVWDAEDGPGSCYARVETKLSDFPSTRLAPRPADFASAMRDTLAEWDVETCKISVQYVNDTEEEIELQDLCFYEEFRFSKRDFWSVSSEQNCWDPADEYVFVD